MVLFCYCAHSKFKSGPACFPLCLFLFFFCHQSFIQFIRLPFLDSCFKSLQRPVNSDSLGEPQVCQSFFSSLHWFTLNDESQARNVIVRKRERERERERWWWLQAWSSYFQGRRFWIFLLSLFKVIIITTSTSKKLIQVKIVVVERKGNTLLLPFHNN